MKPIGTQPVAPSPAPSVHVAPAPPAAGHGAQAGPDPQRAPRERPLILIVDDDPDILAGLCDLLEPQYEALGASDGHEAVAIASAHIPELIVMDIMMPKLNGIQALDLLRQDPRTTEIPVLFLSAQSDASTTALCLDKGGADYVSKPVQIREFTARIERALREARERESLKSLAQTDALTGLANFRALSSRLEGELKRACRYHFPVSVLMIDLDGMKAINDQYGHDVGNQAIVTFARLLQMNLRETDFAARFGGDEFAVILPHHVAADAAKVAERIRSALSNLPDISGSPERPGPRLSASSGVACFSGRSPPCKPEELIRTADAALYEAKRQGRNRVVVHAFAGAS